MNARPFSIGIAGLGTVGTGLVALIRSQERLRLPRPVVIAGVSARSRQTRRDIDISGYQWFDDPADLAVCDGIDAFVELIGGTGAPALPAITAALAAGKSVITANKALLAEHGPDLARLAEANRVHLGFEAAVCGALPIVRAMRDSVCGADIEQITGILNGTCNDVLARMQNEGMSYADSLTHAQQQGYAEADPYLDVSGIDAAHKIALLAALGFAAIPDMAMVAIEGIEHIEALDIEMASALGFRIKLIGRARKRGDKLSCAVGPILIRLDNPLAFVDGPLNAVMVDTAEAGRITMTAPGAGRGPTAMAVLADIAAATGVAAPPFGLPVADLKDRLIPSGDTARAHYLRMRLADRPGSLAALSQNLAEIGVSIDAAHQNAVSDEGYRPIAIMTHPCRRADVEQAVSAAGDLSCMGPSLILPIE